MRIRDYDFIETRLMDTGSATEGAHRLRRVGRDDLADRIMEAAKKFNDECRAVRMEIQGQRGS